MWVITAASLHYTPKPAAVRSTDCPSRQPAREPRGRLCRFGRCWILEEDRAGWSPQPDKLDAAASGPTMGPA
jgi:hypothetical protein